MAASCCRAPGQRGQSFFLSLFLVFDSLQETEFTDTITAMAFTVAWAQAKRAARSVAGGDHDRKLTEQQLSLAANVLIPLSALFPPSRGLTKGQNDPVEKWVLEDEPERTSSVWCEPCRKDCW